MSAVRSGYCRALSRRITARFRPMDLFACHLDREQRTRQSCEARGLLLLVLAGVAAIVGRLSAVGVAQGSVLVEDPLELGGAAAVPPAAAASASASRLA